MALNQNQFALETLKGTKIAGHEDNVMTVEFYSATATDTIAPGSFVKLDSSTVAKNVPRVSVGADEAADYIGVVLTNPMKESFAVGDKMEIGLLSSVVMLEASAAIAAGALCQYAPSTGKCATKTSTNTAVARAIEPAVADGSLFRALIKVI
jgi:hypothetical protein